MLSGHVLGEDGMIDAALRKDMENPPRHLVDPVRGKPASTRWIVRARASEPERTLVRLEPHTGRTHQLRIHACTLGHPIIGDDLYAPPEVVAMGDRLMLHASELTFTHPIGGRRITVKAPEPFTL